MKLKYILFILAIISVLSCKKRDEQGNSDEQVKAIDYVALLSRAPDSEIVVMRCDKPYEKELSFPTIITLDNKYIMYYVVYNGLGARDFSTCYAESIDGINWTKPNIGLIEFNGDKNNNIISNDFEGVCVEYNQGTYYLLTYAADFNTYLYTSSDGINFVKESGFHIPYTCDSQNQIVFDRINNHYKVYLRSWYKSENKNIQYNHTDSLYRAVSLIVTNHPENIHLPMSDNPLWRWGENSGIPPAISNELPVVMRNSSNEDYDIYNSCVHRYWDNSYIA